ncbi:proline dehydrogenase family protein [Bacteroidota bacterium]|nr:proline dehydrogenase family protein [Bacteroidota bacterium]MEC8537359.1 proline dehydrogenase family protein [Bacteroidota bacterium]
MFENTEISFQSKTDRDLKKSIKLFKLLKRNYLVKIGKFLLNIAIFLKIPINSIIKKLFFKQFCGGENIDECHNLIDELSKYNIKTTLDYCIEGKNNDELKIKSFNEILNTIEESKENINIPFCVFKMSGVITLINESYVTDLWCKKNTEKIKTLFFKAAKYNTPILIDAEESWIQNGIDKITEILMKEFNKNEVIIYNTIQLYRKDRLHYIKKLHLQAKKENYKLGFKLVRGAYMEKERKFAKINKAISPIHETKEDCDRDFNNALKYCVQNINDISIFVGTHNEESCIYLTKLMEENNIRKNDDRIYFSQLLGMSDHISYNLARYGYNVSKYVPFGPIKEMIPYLIRRAEENSSVKGQTSRELKLIQKEINRRKSI